MNKVRFGKRILLSISLMLNVQHKESLKIAGR